MNGNTMNQSQEKEIDNFIRVITYSDVDRNGILLDKME